MRSESDIIAEHDTGVLLHIYGTSVLYLQYKNFIDVPCSLKNEDDILKEYGIDINDVKSFRYYSQAVEAVKELATKHGLAEIVIENYFPGYLNCDSANLFCEEVGDLLMNRKFYKNKINIDIIALLLGVIRGFSKPQK